MTTETKPATVTSIETASTARWLTRALERARADARKAPTEDAVDRIRLRVFGEGAKKAQRTIAA